MLPDTADTIVAISSPPGAAWRGIVRLSGPMSIPIARSVFRPHHELSMEPVRPRMRIEGVLSPPGGTTAPASPGAPQGQLDASAIIFRAPGSYTRQDLVEIHTLGSPAVLSMLVEAAVAGGARRAGPGEFTLRAFTSGSMTLEAAEGVAAIVRAGSDAELQAARRLMRGELAKAAAAAREALLDLLALVEAGLDFADEPIEFIQAEELRRRLTEIARGLRTTLEMEATSQRLNALPRVLLWGPPNVGKSALFNRLAGADRAISSPIAGTTRDVLAAPLRLPGLEAVILDAAGVSEQPGELAAAARRATRSAADEAELVLAVTDMSEPSPRPPAMAAPHILVQNKSDLVASHDENHDASAERLQDAPPVVTVSAKTGDGIEHLRETIRAALAARSGEHASSAGALSGECRAALREACDAVQRAAATTEGGAVEWELTACELRGALDGLGVLTGETTPEDVLGRIFSRFCIGK